MWSLHSFVGHSWIVFFLNIYSTTGNYFVNCKIWIVYTKPIVVVLWSSEPVTVLGVLCVPYLTFMEKVPDSLWLQIFDYLEYQDVISVSQCSSTFNRVAEDEILWRNLFHRHFGVPLNKFSDPLCKLKLH